MPFLIQFSEKIKKRYGHLSGKIVRITITRTNSSLGIALAGHKNRNEMGCFIAGINPKGSMRSQDFKVGDEILEVFIQFLKIVLYVNVHFFYFLFLYMYVYIPPFRSLRHNVR